MYKEFIIIFLVLVLVIGLDMLTGNYTKKVVDTMSNELNILKDYILNNESNKIEDQMNKIKKIWEDEYKILAYYIEHDELEKVETQFVLLNADLETKEYNNCIECIETSKYILKHIKDKENLDIISIF